MRVNLNAYRQSLTAWLGGCLALLIATSVQAEPRAYISIIIDDMGDQHEQGLEALNLPGPLTYAFLPQSPHGRIQAELAHTLGKEVMLHQPMEAVTGNPLGPGGLTLNMSHARFNQVLAANLNSIPHVVGINNHMGSLLTRHPGHMQWLMDALGKYGNLFFIDSRTTHHTIAAQLADENHISHRQRDVFLDDDASIEAIEFQFKRLIRKALTNGNAIGIGHPYPTTVTVLKQQLPRLGSLGIQLIPVSQILNKPVIRMAKDPASPSESLVYRDRLTRHQHN